ncbi:hypothetical protein [Sneathia vaginalis]|uniref:hypothetical protein n=1 Tax=Sneathia vaginalis TaxID=187101 RepID=UPI003F76B8CF
MKKTILLASVIASMTTLAVESPKGFVEGTAKGGVTFRQNVSNETKISGDVEELSVKGEVKVNRFTLGAVLANKDLKGISKENPITTEKYTDNLLDHSSVYAKYELPEFSGIKSYVKGTLNPKAPTEDGKHNFKKGNVELEGQLAHSFSNGAEVSLTSKTKFPFEKKDGEYGKGVESEHVLKVAAKKLNKFEDLEASLKLNHTYAKEEAFKFVDLSAKGTYAGLKDTKLTGKANFRYQVNGTSDVKDLLTDGQIKLNKDAYAHSYELDGKYTGVKDLELTAGAFVQHVHYANAELGDYVANPFEYLYAQSLISNDKDFFKHHAEKIEAAKKEFEKAQETIKNTSKEVKDEYQKNVDLYEKLVSVETNYLDNVVKKATDEKNKLTGAEKTTADQSYNDQKKLYELEDKIAKLKNLKDNYEKIYNNAKAEVKNSEFKNSKFKEFTDEISKLTDEYNKLDEKLSNLENAGTILADAESDKKDFDTAKKENDKNDMKNVLGDLAFVKQADGTYLDVSDDSYDGEYGDNVIYANELFDKIKNSEYGNALKIVNAVNDFSIREKAYKLELERYKGLKAKLDLVNFGFKLGAKYTGVKNLTLTADGVFGGRHHSAYDQLLKFPAYTTGYVKLHAGAKYDFKLLNDKLVVSPEGNVTAKFTDIYAGICNPSLVLAPKVSVSYKPMDALKVAGSVELPINFGLNTLGDFGYQSTSIKGALNMKYEWK